MIIVLTQTFVHGKIRATVDNQELEFVKFNELIQFLGDQFDEEVSVSNEKGQEAVELLHDLKTAFDSVIRWEG